MKYRKSEKKKLKPTFCIEQLPIFVQICEKQTVDQGGLSQARFTFKQGTTKEKKAMLKTL